MNETRRFRAGQWCGYVATFTRGRAITEIQITDWGGNNPRIIGVCRKLLNAHVKWEVM